MRLNWKQLFWKQKKMRPGSRNAFDKKEAIFASATNVSITSKLGNICVHNVSTTMFPKHLTRPYACIFNLVGDVRELQHRRASSPALMAVKGRFRRYDFAYDYCMRRVYAMTTTRIASCKSSYNILTTDAHNAKNVVGF